MLFILTIIFSCIRNFVQFMRISKFLYIILYIIKKWQIQTPPYTYQLLPALALHKIVKVYSMEGKLFFPKLLFIFTFVSCIHEGIYQGLFFKNISAIQEKETIQPKDFQGLIIQIIYPVLVIFDHDAQWTHIDWKYISQKKQLESIKNYSHYINPIDHIHESIIHHNMDKIDIQLLMTIDIVINASIPTIVLIFGCYLNVKFSGSLVSDQQSRKNNQMLCLLYVWLFLRLLQITINILAITFNSFIYDFFQGKTSVNVFVQLILVIILVGDIVLVQIIPMYLTLKTDFFNVLVNSKESVFQNVSDESLNTPINSQPQVIQPIYRDVDYTQVKFNGTFSKKLFGLGEIKIGELGNQRYSFRILEFKELSQFVIDETKEDIENLNRIKKGFKILSFQIIETKLMIMTKYYQSGNLVSMISGKRDASVNSQSANQLLYKLEIAIEIAKKLQILHDQGISHGHLCSTNIMFTSKYNIKISIYIINFIVDYGLKALKKYCGYVNNYINKTGYSAPECLIEKGNVVSNPTKEMDIYSLGMIYYEIFQEKHPFQDLTLKQIQQIVTVDKTRPKLIDVNQQVAELIRYYHNWMKQQILQRISKIIRNEYIIYITHFPVKDYKNTIKLQMNQKQKSKWLEFIQIFRHMDLLASPYEFNVSESSQSLTVVGGILSTGLIVCMILYSITLFVKNSNMNNIFAGTQTQQDSQFTLNQDNSVFALQFQTPDGDVISLSDVQQYFVIQLLDIYFQMSASFKAQDNQLSSQNCSQQLIIKDNWINLIAMEENIIYLDRVQINSNLILESAQPNVHQDASHNQKQQVFSIKGIQQYHYQIDDVIKNQLNLTEPAETFAMNTFCNVNNLLAVEEDLFFSPAIIDLSNNIQYSLRNKHFQVQQEVTSLQQEFSIHHQQHLCTFNLRYSSDSKYYFAIDQSIFPLVLLSISQASGLAIAIIGFMKFIYKVYATHKTFETIMNYVFKFDLAQQKEDIDEVDEGDEDQHKMNHSQVKKFGQSEISEVLAQELEFNFWDNMRLRTYKFFAKFNITKSCCNCLGKVQPKVTLAYMAQKKIQKDLDLANIVQKLYEIDFLKLYLFDDQQLILFNSFCCPILNDNIRSEQEKKKEYKRLKPTKTSVFDKIDPDKQDQQQDSAYSSNSKYYYKLLIVPIEGRLSKYSRFFNAQLRFETISELADAYHRMNMKKYNDDSEKQKLFKFINYNKTLIKAVNILKNSKLKQPKFLETVNQMMMFSGHNQGDVK
ncbi:hypothetical protein pb186bvf_020327, partial [Paramecium bursaria]